MGVPRERGTKDFSAGKSQIPPESKSTAIDIPRRFGEIAVDVQRYKR